MSDGIRAQAERVQAARLGLLVNEEVLNRLRDAWDMEHAELIEAVNASRLLVARESEALRALALAAFEACGNKRPGPGVAIREVTKMDYDPIVALDWAKEHDLCLTLDRKNFEDLAKRRPADFAFVEYRNEPQATISTDLSKALGLEERQNGDK